MVTQHFQQLPCVCSTEALNVLCVLRSRGVVSSEVSMSEVSQIEREEEERLARIEEDAAENDDSDSSGSTVKITTIPSPHESP